MMVLGFVVLFVGIGLIIISSFLLALSIGLRELIKTELKELANDFIELEESIHTTHLMLEEMDQINSSRDKKVDVMGSQMQHFANDVHMHIAQLARQQNSLN